MCTDVHRRSLRSPVSCLVLMKSPPPVSVCRLPAVRASLAVDPAERVVSAIAPESVILHTLPVLPITVTRRTFKNLEPHHAYEYDEARPFEVRLKPLKLHPFGPRGDRRELIRGGPLPEVDLRLTAYR